MVKHLLLVRHAAIGPQYAGRYVGALDLPAATDALSDLGRLAALVAPYKPRHCLVSPLQRSRQTAAALLAELSGARPAMEIDADLREVDFGRWEGKSFAEIGAADPELVAQWSRGEEEFSFPDGESLKKFGQRVRAVAAQLIARPEASVLAITHGGVIRALLCHLLGLAPEYYLLFDIRPGTLTVIDIFAQGGVLAGLNLGLEGRK